MADINVQILDTEINVTSPGTQGPAGSGLVWLGAYNNLTAYNLKDAVSYLGSSYVCILASTGNLPTNGTYWNILAQSGYSGYSGFSGQSGASTSGYSGYSGISGYSGFSGIDGQSGYSGISGYSGFSGFSGISGFSGLSGISGYSGYSGISGYSGFSGISGFSGLDGVAQSGISGYSGYSGISGYSGFSGISGFSGFSGVSGYSGADGINGTNGASGISGYSGFSGISGYSGFSGISGYSGTNGTIGSDGVSGFSGYSGISGYSGYSGIDGASGFSGISGYSGFSGISGYSGVNGASGISGYSGYSGIGTSGFSGYSGYSGPAGAFTWGSTVSAGSGIGLTMTSADLGGGNAFTSFAHTASGTLTSCTTTQNTYTTSRTATGGTASDNFIGTLFSRVNATNGANLTSAGSVVSITGSDTQTANTLTPTYDLLSLVPSLRSTGSSINLSIPNSIVTAPTNAHFYAVFGGTQTVVQTLMKLSTGTSTLADLRALAIECITTQGGTALSGGMTLNCFSSTQQPVGAGSYVVGMHIGRNFNTTANYGFAGMYFENEANSNGSAYNTSIRIENNSTKWRVGSNFTTGGGLSILQQGAAGTAFDVYGTNNVNSSTNGLVNYTLSNTQSGVTVIQKINSGTSAQGNTCLYVLAQGASTAQKGVHIDGNVTLTGYLLKLSGGTLATLIDYSGESTNAGVNRTKDYINFDIGRLGGITGTISDNFNLCSLKRTNSTDASGRHLTAVGSVLKLENAASASLGTLSDTVTVLKIVQSTTSTGDIFAAFSGATKKFYIDSTGNTTPVGRLMLPMGEVSYFSTTGTSVTISGTSDGSTNMVVVAPTSSLDNDMEFDNGGSNNGRLRYTGATTKTFHIAVTLSGSPATNNDEFVFGVAKNGTVDTTCKVIQKFGTTADTQSTALHCMASLATNDYLELYVGNLSGARNVTIKTLNIFAMGM